MSFITRKLRRIPAAPAENGPVVPGEPLPPLGDPVERLVGVLTENGTCDARTVARARRVAAENGQRLDTVLIGLGLVSERGLATGYAALLGLPLAAPDRYPTAEPLLPDRLPLRFLRDNRVLPISLAEGVLTVAAADPLDPFMPAAIAAASGLRVALEVAVPIELDAALNQLYPDAGVPAGHDDAGDATAANEDDAERLKDLASEAPVIRLVNGLIARAVETAASDIHIEPFEDLLRIRYRYDGVLHEADSPPARMAAAVTSRIKIMARLDIAERRLPQDGRIKMAVRGQEVDFRVSTVPSLHGETVVLRVLDRNAVAFDYDRLGLPAPVVRQLGTALDQPNGIVLVTGPTGSGKTTTLYTGLLSLDSLARKIVTIEDPIEYQLAGVSQIQVKPQIGLSFATLLRSILRQDPDVIMVGEIRDGETAQIAVQAALTGHLVLSTVHTNSAASTVARLRDMGLEDYLLAAVLRGVLAQRLVRRLCTHCRKEAEASGTMIERFGLRALKPEGRLSLFHPVGCPHCRGTGFRGRQAIAEFVRPGPEIERLIFNRADTAAIEAAAVQGGMVPMFEAGLRAALDGTTTVEEVVRSVRAADG